MIETSFQDKKGETNIHYIFENLENKDNKNLSFITSKEDKYKRLLFKFRSIVNLNLMNMLNCNLQSRLNYHYQ